MVGKILRGEKGQYGWLYSYLDGNNEWCSISYECNITGPDIIPSQCIISGMDRIQIQHKDERTGSYNDVDEVIMRGWQKSTKPLPSEPFIILSYVSCFSLCQ